MRVVGYSEFRNNLAHNLNVVNEDTEIVIVARAQGKNVVVIDMDEYNSIMETLHLVSTSANRKRIDEAIEEMNKGISFSHDLIEE